MEIKEKILGQNTAGKSYTCIYRSKNKTKDSNIDQEKSLLLFTKKLIL